MGLNFLPNIPDIIYNKKLNWRNLFLMIYTSSLPYTVFKKRL